MSQYRPLQFILFTHDQARHHNIEHLINGIFNNSLNYVLVCHSNSTTTSLIGIFWYNFLRNHTWAYFSGHPVNITSNDDVFNTICAVLVFKVNHANHDLFVQQVMKHNTWNIRTHKAKTAQVGLIKSIIFNYNKHQITPMQYSTSNSSIKLDKSKTPPERCFIPSL